MGSVINESLPIMVFTNSFKVNSVWTVDNNSTVDINFRLEKLVACGLGLGISQANSRYVCSGRNVCPRILS